MAGGIKVGMVVMNVPEGRRALMGEKAVPKWLTTAHVVEGRRIGRDYGVMKWAARVLNQHPLAALSRGARWTLADDSWAPARRNSDDAEVVVRRLVAEREEE